MNQMWIFFFIILCFTGGLFATDIIVQTQPTIYGKESQDVQIPCSSNMLFSRTIVKWKLGATLENAIVLVFLDHGAVGGPLFDKGYDLFINGSLLIKNVTTTNSGLYFCIVEDSLGNTGYNTSRLVVNLKPVLSQLVINFCGMHNPNCTRKFQTNVTLPLVCTARSERAAVSLNWKSNVSDVPQRIQSLTEEQDGIFISNAEINVQLIDAAQYVCYVLNTEEYNLPESSIYINISPVHFYPEKGQLTIEPSSCNKWTVPVTMLCTIIAVAVISVITRILYKKFHKTYIKVPSSCRSTGLSAPSRREEINSGINEVPSTGDLQDRQENTQQTSNVGIFATSGSDEENSSNENSGGIYAEVAYEKGVPEHVYPDNSRDRHENAQQTFDVEFQVMMTIKAREGATVTLPCSSSETRDAVWIRRTLDGGNQFLYAGRMCASTENFLTSNGNLTIVKLEKRHQGLYITGPFQNFQNDFIATAYDVICDESCHYINYTTVHGSTIILPVDYSLRDESDKVKWSRESLYGEIGYIDKYKRQHNGNLWIDPVDGNDNCIFRCKLHNKSIYYSVTVVTTEHFYL